MSTWWNDFYVFRIPINLDSTLPIPANHPVTITLKTASTLDLGKMRSDFEDVEVVYWEEASGDLPVFMPRSVSDDGTNVTISFNVLNPFEGQLNGLYYIYYGNLDAESNPNSRPNYSSNEWPVSIGVTDAGISFVRPGEEWIDGICDTYHSVATVPFYGSQVRVINDTGRSYGIQEIRIDSGNYRDVDLFANPDISNVVTATYTGLSKTMHYLQIRCPKRSNPSAVSTQINIKRVEYKAYIDINDAIEELNPNLGWTSILTGGDNG